MINNQVNKMIEMAILLKQAIKDDISDVKAANHEKLLDRNDEKLELMQNISDAHSKLNQLLAQAMQDGEDLNQYRQSVDNLEEHLRELYDLNGKLASIVLPVKQMYKQIIDDISAINGGSLFEVIA
jgi:DNA repair exonuclease SbcCD ATPase subunit